MPKPNLSNVVAVVAGATRGGGRGIAIELGACGATVYCTGRTSSVNTATSDLNRKETIEETAQLVTDAGGQGISVCCDHSNVEQVQALFEKVKKETEGTSKSMQILVNCVWGGDHLTEWGTKFWELNLEKSQTLLNRAIQTHLITAQHGTPVLLETAQKDDKNCIIFEITDGKTYDYRRNVIYDLAKVSVMRLALGMADDLKDKPNVFCIGLTPGFLRSEAMLEHFDVTKDTWREAIAMDPFFESSETPHFLGKSVAYISGASREFLKENSGKTLASWDMAEKFDFDDIDGNRPHWERFFEANKSKLDQQ